MKTHWYDRELDPVTRKADLVDETLPEIYACLNAFEAEMTTTSRKLLRRCLTSAAIAPTQETQKEFNLLADELRLLDEDLYDARFATLYELLLSIREA